MYKKILLPLILFVACNRSEASPVAGFFLPDSLFEFSMHYKTIDNLIILPVAINDSVSVNLILDTGCRNMLLFGRRFEKYFRTESKLVQFSGLGSGKPVTGKLSLNNNVSIQAVAGKQIPIIIVAGKNLFASLPGVDGIIGYEIFAKFEIEINFREQLITFRTASHTFPFPGFEYISMKVVDSRPVVECIVSTQSGEQTIHDLLIDTGSSLGLIYSTSEKIKKSMHNAVGRGLNGLLNGKTTTTKKLKLSDVEFNDVNTSIVYSSTSYASIGMDILKDQVVILNYSRSYAAFRSQT
jgi:hypothetical protein